MSAPVGLGAGSAEARFAGCALMPAELLELACGALLVAALWVERL